MFHEKTLTVRLFKTLRMILVFLVIGLVMVWARAFYGSKQTYYQAVACLEAGQLVNAVAFFDRSIRWYTPLNPYVRLSAQRLWEIGRQAEQQGNVHLALIAVRTLRRGFYGARHLWGPGQEWIDTCSAKIDELMDSKQPESETPKDAFALGGSNGLSGRLARNPSTLWSIAVGVGFLGWIGSVIGFVMSACKGDNRLRLSPSPALIWAGITLSFFALWIVGMIRA